MIKPKRFLWLFLFSQYTVDRGDEELVLSIGHRIKSFIEKLVDVLYELFFHRRIIRRQKEYIDLLEQKIQSTTKMLESKIDDIAALYVSYQRKYLCVKRHLKRHYPKVWSEIRRAISRISMRGRL